MRAAVAVALAASCAIAMSARPPAASAVDREVRKMARSSQSSDRIDAVWALAKAPDEGAAALLADLLVDDDALVRDNAVVAASRFTGAEAAERLTKRARARNPIDRANVATALAMTGHDAVLPTVREIVVEDRDADVRRAAAWELSRFEDSPAAFEIAREAASDEDPRVRAAAVRAARFTGGAASRDLVVGALDDPDDRVRYVALVQTWALGEDVGVPAMRRMASDRSHRVRVGAATLAWSYRTKDAIDVLVPLVADEREHVAALAHRTLRLITKKSLDRDPELWTAWWAGARESWRPRKDVDKRWFWDDKYASPASVYGARLTSDALVIVVDVSETLARATSTEETRWDEVRGKLLEAIARLEDGTLLNVVTMGDDVETAFPAPRALDDGERKRIARFLSGVRPGGGCDLWGGLSTAFGQPGIDTVLVVSSERRDRGEVRHNSRVWGWAQREYFTNALIVHTVRIAIGDDDAPQFLHNLAEDTLGRARKRVF